MSIIIQKTLSGNRLYLKRMEKVVELGNDKLPDNWRFVFKGENSTITIEEKRYLFGIFTIWIQRDSMTTAQKFVQNKELAEVIMFIHEEQGFIKAVLEHIAPPLINHVHFTVYDERFTL